MKLGKEEIQKMFLGGLMLIGLVYVYFNLLLGPLVARQGFVRKSIVDLDPQIAAAQAQIKKTADLEVTAPKAAQTLAQVGAMIPEGSPVAWFPKRLGDFFKHQGTVPVNPSASHTSKRNAVFAFAVLNVRMNPICSSAFTLPGCS